MKKLKQLLSGKVVSNVSWILFQNVYAMFLGLIVTGIIARHYGTSGYGLINFASSFVAIFSFLAVFGTNHIIIKDLSEKKYDVGVVLGSNLLIRLLLSLLALIISQSVAIIFYNLNVNIAILLFNINA